MHLTRHSDYALRILLQLAARPDDRPSIAEIAAIHGISRNHLMKVVHELGKGGFIATMRGRGGGIALARPAADIMVGEVVRFTEPSFQAADCGSCVIAPACGLTAILDEAMQAFLSVLDKYSIADAAKRPDRLSQLIQRLAATAALADADQ